MAERILVAGGAGFIGMHLCRTLLEQGHQVYCLDNFSTSEITARHDLEQLGAFVEEADVTLATDRVYDAVYHLASPASPVHYRRLSLSTMWANALGARRLLDLSTASRGRFLLASTSEVYGDPLVHPQPETYWGNVNPLGERAVYDESKRFAEALTWEYRRMFNTNARIVRIFNTFGPGMALNDGRAIPAFAVAALTNQPMRIQGTGDHTRCFCFVDDLVRGLLQIGQHSAADGHVYNIGNDHEITVLELAETIRDIVGSTSPIVREAAAADDPTRRKPDLTEILRDYGWSAMIDLREGLTRTLDDIAHRLHASGELPA
ncbi:MAG: NAD-dependent epimerase/dehydratase family protein [Thermomicrobiales bacterium]